MREILTRIVELLLSEDPSFRKALRTMAIAFIPMAFFVFAFCYAGYPEFGINAMLGIVSVVFVAEVILPTLEEWFPRLDTRRLKMTLFSIAGTVGLAAAIYLRVTGGMS